MFFKQIVLCFILLLVTEYFGDVSGLSQGDEGVCVVKISSKKTKRISYTRYTNKWCGIRKCIVKAFRNQPYVVTSELMMCCSGWQYQSHQDVCVPLCSAGCQGGRCVAPEICQCDSPARLDPDHPNICLTPVCDAPCVNANCSSNNTCACLHDFQVFNRTHCYKCDHGYDINSNFECAPKCDSLCVNGICTAPNVCSCSPGYILKDNFTCVPKCDSPCVNGSCVAPNICSCASGYILKNNSCIPECKDCVNAKCEAPNTCVCFEGFIAINDTHCEPNCDDCINGVCVSAGVCECDVGYTKVNASAVNRMFARVMKAIRKMKLILMYATSWAKSVKPAIYMELEFVTLLYYLGGSGTFATKVNVIQNK
ncbi:unnamed protein product [Diatraea saccharalis]|uniref:EGF-like domain-containing protein n=1 Tax=Diatraea saccharalis TaxID=40085 RepID=A0A9N9RFT5_9NEOP|nr:unnamed protein product [Diatraea saccharalis]